MHKIAITAATLLAVTFPQAAFALKTSDTMSDWAQASDQERSKTLDQLLAMIGKPSQVSRSDLLDCLNRAGGVGGHGGLAIDEIARACSAPPSSDGADSDQTGI